ncbi:MAG TPA: ABC transporter permease [Terriglobales bacterium]|nr:ABC transporter permease [Terriglobales bacterium]
MIGTLLRIHWINLRRDRVAQMLSFVVPVAFFTIFGLVFGNGGRGGTPRVHVAVVDESHSEVGARLVRALKAEKGLIVLTRTYAAAGDTTRVPIDRARAEALVRRGIVPVALVIPAGIDTSLMRYGREGGGVPIELLSDPSDPVAPQMVGGLLQKVAMTAAPDLYMKRGVDEFERYTGPMTPRQKQSVDQWLPVLRARAESLGAGGSARSDTGSSPELSGMVGVKVTPLLGRKEDTSYISYYAAGIVVMFLLFTASAVAGTLLDEVDSGTLDRLLSSRLGMTGLLAGKWTYMTLLGIVQVTVMFVYAMLVFRLDLLHHLPGFFVMTVLMAGTTGAFGLFLASICRTRAQLGGFSLLLILAMSAVGGSMFPRFLMTPTMQKLGLATFNGWALDGYLKVFWRDAPLSELAPHVAVLLGFMVVFLALARLFARRWERA